MLSDRVSNPGPLTYESGALPIVLRGPAEETDSIKFKITSKTSRGKKDNTNRHHHNYHRRQPGEQQCPVQVVTG